MKLKQGQFLFLPDWLRPALAQPFGTTMSEEETVKKLEKRDTYIITVGDETTKTLIRYGIEPNLAIFDLKTKRRETQDSELQKHYVTRERIKNPQKQITFDLWHAIEKSLKRKKAAIQVNGEEDLAALPCAYMAKDGSVMLYGIPNVGISFVLIDNGVKAKVKNLIDQMEVKSAKP